MASATSKVLPLGGTKEGSKSGRLLSLDILRGITVAAMIFVNNGYGESYEMLGHSKWNGMTPCDLVFPFFLFIMGVSTYLSLSKYNFQPTWPVVRKILKRTFLMFFLGVFIHWFDSAVWGDPMCFDHLRIWAVLQRIALCYCGCSLFAIFCNHKYIIPTIVALLAVYSAILIWGNGYAEDSATNILAQVDLKLFGYEHLYHKSPVDPEGLVGTISGIAHALIGFYLGKKLKESDSLEKKMLAFFVVGSVLVFGGYLLSYGLPLNKRIWSPSYVLATCGLASLLQGVLMYIIDMKGKKQWAKFFHVFGVNALALYASSEFLVILFWRFNIPPAIYSVVHTIIPPEQPASVAYALVIVLVNFLLVGYPLYRNRIYIKL